METRLAGCKLPAVVLENQAPEKRWETLAVQELCSEKQNFKMEEEKINKFSIVLEHRQCECQITTTLFQLTFARIAFSFSLESL